MHFDYGNGREEEEVKGKILEDKRLTLTLELASVNS